MKGARYDQEGTGHLAGHFFLTAALAMQGELTAAAAARDTLLGAPARIFAHLDDGKPAAYERVERAPLRRLPKGWSAAGMTATRRLAAILAADVAGYSRLMGMDEEGTLERLKAPPD